MTSSAVRRVHSALARQPRLPLAQLPTPIHDAVRLREALGGPARCPRILIKRDDLTALGLGGNKARKLEYLVADAQAKGATTLDHDRRRAVESRAHDRRGGVRRRHAVRAGADGGGRKSPALGRQPAARSLSTAPPCGWCRRSIPCWPLDKTRRWLRRWSPKRNPRGGTPYVIPVGGSSGIGVFGYVGGTAELVGQLADDGRGAKPLVLRQRIHAAHRPD